MKYWFAVISYVILDMSFFPWAIINLICGVRRMVPAGFRLMAAVHQLDGVVS